MKDYKSDTFYMFFVPPFFVFPKYVVPKLGIGTLLGGKLYICRRTSPVTTTGH